MRNDLNLTVGAYIERYLPRYLGVLILEMIGTHVHVSLQGPRVRPPSTSTVHFNIVELCFLPTKTSEFKSYFLRHNRATCSLKANVTPSTRIFGPLSISRVISIESIWVLTTNDSIMTIASAQVVYVVAPSGTGKVRDNNENVSSA